MKNAGLPSMEYPDSSGASQMTSEWAVYLHRCAMLVRHAMLVAEEGVEDEVPSLRAIASTLWAQMRPLMADFAARSRDERPSISIPSWVTDDIVISGTVAAREMADELFRRAMLWAMFALGWAERPDVPAIEGISWYAVGPASVRQIRGCESDDCGNGNDA